MSLRVYKGYWHLYRGETPVMGFGSLSDAWDALWHLSVLRAEAMGSRAGTEAKQS